MRLSESNVSRGKGNNQRYQSSSSSSSSGGFNGNRDKKKQKQKQKRLDAICDQVYNGNRVIEVESNEGNAGSNSGLLRRSSRVRKAPAVLDVSPSPVKKRRRIDNVGGSSSSSDKKNEGCVDRQKGEDRLEMSSPVPNSENLDEPGSWKSRLRSRVNSVSFALKEKGASPRGKRKLFGRFGESRQVLKVNGMDTNEKRGLIKEGKSLIAKSTRAASEEEANISRKSEDEPTISSDKEDGDDMDMGGRLLNLENEDIIMLNATNDNGYDTVVTGNSYKEVSDKQETEMQDGSQMKDELSQRRELDTTVRSDMQLEQTSEKERNCDDALEMVEPIIDNGGSRESTHDTCLDKLKQMQIDCMTKIRMRGGRRCGLCGGGSDGKAPKRLVDDHVESDNEAYGGSSASEDTTYNILDGFSDEPGWLGGLLGPINDRFGIACVWVHQHCAVWSPEVYFAGLGCLKNVRAALCRGRTLKCSRCGRAGATIGCRVDRCPKTYHLPCARADGCVFDHHKYLITCTDHRHLFQPHGSQLLKRLKKLEIKKMKLEMRKHSHEASRKDFEMEEKWLENCGEDEEFLKREGKRLQRDLSRLSPVYIGGSNSESGNLYQGWESVAGLQNVIQCMKEVVILPLLYPEFFSSLGLTPPRGVLLHGHPGTGKTLVVRALIGSCARGDKRIAYFARKGADCLGKYVGDAERQLRLLFQVAEKSQPSIIFFDEIDGLAPCRSRQQDQTHNSVVSTLLALLDGLKSRGSVVVIGATNRPDAVDPALRRPGRFDREIYFPLPSVKDRAAILSLHTERWPKPVNRSLLNWIAQKTVGFAGADLQSLCTQAAMISLKRNCGWQELMMSSAGKKANDICPPLLSFSVEERDWLEALACAPPPCSRREAGTAANDVVTSSLQTHLIPCLLQPLSFLLVSLFLDERIRLPPSLYQAAKVIESVLLSVLEKKQMPTDVWWCHLNNLIQEADVVKEIETNLSRDGLLVGQSDFANSDILDDSYNDNNKLELQKASLAGANANLLRSVSNSSGSLSGFRILIAGSPGSGQSHLASCILHGFVGRVEIQKVDLATISQEGYGDAVRGITHKLLKCGGSGLCIIYMPRIDLWAIETNDLVDEAESVIHDIAHKSTDPAGSFDATAFVSQAWNTFTEQVDSTYLSASVIVLATSEVPNEILPRGISQFFTSDVSNGKDSASMQHTIPRFLVKLDGNFDCDMAINSSVTELSRRLVQHYVQLIHYKTHVGNMSEEVYDTIEGDPVTENQERESGVSSKGSDAVNSGRTALNGSDQIQHYINSESSPGVLIASGQQENKAIPGHIQVPRPLNNRTVKGKPSLLCAISAFGYQILRYPHFSELCWATSKLKDGPYTEINGPWKVWPFNSCVIHPTPSVENVAVTRNSCNLNKRKESGVVRGLVAIGMLAYRGAYSSVIEVSSEVRKVLEILVEETNAKILRGKDKFRFLRLLSQVAYLEDVVNSWAQTIQSLELHNQMPLSNTERTVVGSANNPPSGQTCIPSDSPKDSHEIQVEGQSSQRYVTEIDQLIDASNGYETGITVLEGPSRQVTFLDHSSIGNPQKSSSLGNLLATESTSSFHRRIEHAGNGKSEDHVIVNGLTEESAVSPSHVVCSTDKAGETAISNTIKVGDYCNVSSIANTGPSNDSEPPEDVNFTSSKKIGVSAMSGMTCLYSCCSGCLHKISVLVRKLLLHEKERKGSCWTVEDVHTAVSSWSVNLLSAVRELCVAESVECAESFENNVRHENGKFCSCPKLSFAHSKETLRHSRSTGNGVTMPMECSCDLESRSVTANIDSCTNLQSGSGLNFFFRNNVLIPSGSEKDVIFHCKYENFCLGSLVDLVLMIEPPLD